MARLVLVSKVTPGSYPVLPLPANAADFTWTPAGASFGDGFSIPYGPGVVLLARNDDVAAQTITIDSLPAGKTRRTGSISAYSLGAGEYAVFGPFEKDGWVQTDGTVYGAASDADVKFAVIQLG